jgi:putative spermidine/putrescine transport system permease protein
MAASRISAGQTTRDELTLAIPLALFFAVFFIAPLAMLVVVSFYADVGMTRFGAGSYVQFLTDPYSLQVMGSTLLLGLEVTLTCLLFGYPLAVAYTRASGWLKTMLLATILLPLLTSVVVRTFAWIVILGRQGVINSALLTLGWIDSPLRLIYTQGGVVLALAQVQLPLMTLPIITVLTRLDPHLSEASSALGANAWRTFFRITLPLTVPGILAGCVLCFASAVTAFVTQGLIGGGQMMFMPMYVYQQATALQNWPFAAAISVLFLLAVLAALALISMIAHLSRGMSHA